MGGLGTTLWGSLIPGGGSAPGTGSGTQVQDILYAAMRAAGILTRAGRGPSQSELADAFNTFNRLVDTWGARKVFAYNVNFSEFQLEPNHQPHLIGPGLAAPDWDAPRPVRIENAALILTNVPQPVDVPLTIRDDDWWAQQRVKAIATSVPTDLYYSPSVPNGAIYLWPVPTFAYKLRLEAWVSLAKAENQNSYIVCPPAYEEALVWSLAEKLCVLFGRPIAPELADQARKARTAAQSNNAASPRTSSADYGMRGRRGGFNYYTGR